MRSGFTTLVHQPTKVSDPAPSDTARELARTYGSLQQDLADALADGDRRLVSTLSRSLHDVEGRLHRIAACAGATPATVECARRALGLEEPVPAG